MEKKILSVVLTILIAVLGWTWVTNFSKLCEIERSLVELKIDIVRMQESLVDRDEVKRIVNDELAKHGIR